MTPLLLLGAFIAGSLHSAYWGCLLMLPILMLAWLNDRDMFP